MITTIDDHGRIQLPAEVLKNLDLGPGDTVDLQTSATGLVVVSAHDRSALQRRHGILVHTGVAEGDIAETIRSTRAERDRTITRGMLS